MRTLRYISKNTEPGEVRAMEHGGIVKAQADAGATATRASDAERDAVVTRLRDAFADGRLDDSEFDQRTRAALTAKTRADLDRLLRDLPPEAAPAPPVPVTGRGPGRFALAYKGAVRRAGRWRVPDRYTAVVYKGSGLLDLRAAQLTSPVTTIIAVAYKSRVNILVPPGVQVDMTGSGVVQHELDAGPGYRPPPGAPVLRVRAIGYKGTVEVSSRPS
jgi:hypothetical protein